MKVFNIAKDNFLIQIDTAELDKLSKEITGFEKKITTAAVRSLRKTADSTVAAVCKYVSEEYKVKQKDVRATIKKVYPKNDGNMEAVLISTGHTLSFAHFPFTPKTDKRAKKDESIFKNAVFVQIKVSKGPVLSKKGFVAKTGAKSADKIQFNVFRRLGKERLPIAPIRTLSIPQMITSTGMGEKIANHANKKFAGMLEHEVMHEMDKINKRIR